MKGFYLIGVLWCILILQYTGSLACSCSTPVLNDSLIVKTTYVALVKITQIVSGSAYKGQYLINIEELQHFKGEKATQISVIGYNPKLTPNTSSSCDLDVKENQEWLIIGFVDSLNRPSLYMCSNSVMYRAANGLRDWAFKRGFRELEIINRHFKISPPSKPVSNNRIIEKYARQNRIHNQLQT